MGDRAARSDNAGVNKQIAHHAFRRLEVLGRRALAQPRRPMEHCRRTVRGAARRSQPHHPGAGHHQLSDFTRDGRGRGCQKGAERWVEWGVLFTE